MGMCIRISLRVGCEPRRQRCGFDSTAHKIPRHQKRVRAQDTRHTYAAPQLNTTARVSSLTHSLTHSRAPVTNAQHAVTTEHGNTARVCTQPSSGSCVRRARAVRFLASPRASWSAAPYSRPGQRLPCPGVASRRGLLAYRSRDAQLSADQAHAEPEEGYLAVQVPVEKAAGSSAHCWLGYSALTRATRVSCTLAPTASRSYADRKGTGRSMTVPRQTVPSLRFRSLSSGLTIRHSQICVRLHTSWLCSSEVRFTFPRWPRCDRTILGSTVSTCASVPGGCSTVVTSASAVVLVLVSCGIPTTWYKFCVLVIIVIVVMRAVRIDVQRADRSDH